jgi:hypothetical protein
MHDQVQGELESIPHEDIDADGAHSRFLAEPTWGPIRIHADYTHLVATPEMKAYIQKIMPAAISYISSTLQVQQLNNITVAKYRTSTCGLRFPTYYFNGTIQADLVLFVTAENSSASYIAWAQACSILASTGRPIFGQINFNLASFKIGSDKEFYRSLIISLHELTHVLGFSSAFFSKYPNAKFANKTIGDGNFLYYLDVAPLTQRLRAHFNCSTIVGAYLENEGGTGTAASHFERRIFMNELMTGSEIKDMRITEFTLAALEGSGWYKVNYSMAEPIHWGKNKGCGFIDDFCVNKTSQKAQFVEFCSTFGKYGCTFNRKSGGYCGSVTTPFRDPFLDPAFNYWGNNSIVDDFNADNCPYIIPYTNLDCENDALSGSGLIAAEYYGEGSKCFMGNLYPIGALKKNYSYCLKNTCEKQENGTFFLRVTFGANSALCTKAGNTTVPGYLGNLDCPDPNEFCTTVGADYCPRGCTGKGICQSNGKCQCQDGWRGIDCSIKIEPVNLEGQNDPTVRSFNPNDVEKPTGSKPQTVDGLPVQNAPKFDPADVQQENKNNNKDNSHN